MKEGRRKGKKKKGRKVTDERYVREVMAVWPHPVRHPGVEGTHGAERRHLRCKEDPFRAQRSGDDTRGTGTQNLRNKYGSERKKHGRKARKEWVTLMRQAGVVMKF